MFVQVADLSYGGLVDIKLYRLIQIPKFQNNTPDINSKIVKNSINSFAEEGPDPSIFGSSASASSRNSKNSTALLDGQLKDFKKKIMENNEPSQVAHIRKILGIIMMIVSVFSTIIFVYNIEAFSQVSTTIDVSLNKVLR